MSKHRDRRCGPGSGSFLDPILEKEARSLLEAIGIGVNGKALYRTVAGFADLCAEHLPMVNSVRESPADRRYAAALARLRHALDAKLTHYECYRAALYPADIQRLVERWLVVSQTVSERGDSMTAGRSWSVPDDSSLCNGLDDNGGAHRIAESKGSRIRG